MSDVNTSVPCGAFYQVAPVLRRDEHDAPVSVMCAFRARTSSGAVRVMLVVLVMHRYAGPREWAHIVRFQFSVDLYAMDEMDDETLNVLFFQNCMCQDYLMVPPYGPVLSRDGVQSWFERPHSYFLGNSIGLWLLSPFYRDQIPEQVYTHLDTTESETREMMRADLA